jgi:hypothetical protein
MTTRPITTRDVPSSVLRRWLAVLPADSESACIYRRELDRRICERDERITLRTAARLLGVPTGMLRRYSEAGIIREADRYLGESRYWRAEIERWARWSSMEGLPDA